MAEKFIEAGSTSAADPQLKYWASLRLLPGFDLHWQTFMGHFKDARSFWEADASEFRLFRSISPSVLESLLQQRKDLDPNSVLGEIFAKDIRVLTPESTGYPRQLLNIHHPPPVLYQRGKALKDRSRNVAVVGTRKASAYAKEVAANISGELSRHGVTVVSGAAMGIDRSAHLAALEHPGGTVAVIGCGLDLVYPKSNTDLYKMIQNSGTLLSEHPPGTPALPHHFPARNRIISGLASGTVVIEAPEKSGALITANFALDQGREVMVVPGSVLSGNNKGGHRLIRAGAALVEDAGDVFEVLKWQFERQDQVLPGVSLLEWKVLEELGWNSTQLEDLIERMKLDPGTVTSLLTMLELKGYIRQEVGKRYLRVN